MDSESKSSSSDATPHILALALGLLVGAVVVGSFWLSSRSTQSENADVVRNVTVDFMYETDPGSASGNSDLAVESIRFFPGYVVVTSEGGFTRVLAVDRLRSFTYRPTDQ